MTNKKLFELLKLVGEINCDYWRAVHPLVEAIKEGQRIVWWVNDRGFSRIVYQYLQSQGYALPWRGLSVEDLIKSGVYEF